ncbi:Arylsulfatase [Planctomycetes bacterium MalM25]|nr:Arylsulfatase [Planctomycetes bacterium MalM25]
MQLFPLWRRFLTGSFLTVIVAGAGLGQDRPNVLLILADDAGYGDLACFGGEQLPTPRLDRMAAEGTRLTQHYAGSTVCAPSRCVLITGKHIGHATVRSNGPGSLSDGEPTIGTVLSAAGYRTGCFGKWGLGRDLGDDDPSRCGFADFYGYVSMRHAHNFYPEYLVRNGVREPLRNKIDPEWRGEDGTGVASERVDYAPELITEEALRFLDENRERPFFLYLAYNTPHANNEAGNGPRPEKGMEVPDFGPYADRDWPAPEKGFAEMMRRLDTNVGRMLDKIAALGLDERTLVIFSSDNGPHSEGGHAHRFFNSNGPLKGMKRDLYEGGVRVPTIVRWPGRVAAGATTTRVSGFQDWLPTLADAAGADTPAGIDGVSLAPTLWGDPADQAEHAGIYFEFTEKRGRRSIRRGDWKAVQYDVSTNNPKPIELYDLANDLGEENDLAAEHPEIVAELQAAMDAAHTRSEGSPLFPREKERAAKQR